MQQAEASFADIGRRPAHVRFGPKNGHLAIRAACPFCANSGLMRRTKFVLFATSLPRLSIGCAITGLIATAVSNRAGRPADVWSNADSWLAKPSQAVQYRRD